MTNKFQEPECPECERLFKVSGDSNKIGEFLDWLGEQGMQLATLHVHTDECRGSDGFINCGYRDRDLVPIYESFEKLLARYFGIDLNKVEQEREALLEAIRKANEGGG